MIVIFISFIIYYNNNTITEYLENKPNILLVKEVLTKYIQILKGMELYKAFAAECESIQLIESGRGALTVGNVIQICCNDQTEFNEIIYVLIHELTHIYLKSSEHDDLFDQTFDTFLNIAIKHNLYDHVDYTKINRTFCGEKI